MSYDTIDCSSYAYGRMRPLSLQVARTSDTVLDMDLLKTHLRLDDDALEDLLLMYEQVAIQWVEKETRRSLLAREHVLAVSDFPRLTKDQTIILPRGKCQSISKIEYQQSGEAVTMYGPTAGSPGGSDYLEDLRSENGGRIQPLVGQSWPSVDTEHIAPVVITYIAGWTSAQVPVDIKHAMMFAISDMLEFPGSADMQTQLYLGGNTFDARNALLSNYVITRLY